MAETSLLTGLLSVNALSVVYDQKRILNELTFTIRPGEIVAVLGKSGCGKSSLLRAIGGLEPHSIGSISLGGNKYVENGKWLVNAPISPPDVTLVFQDFGLFPNLNALGNVTLPLRMARKLSRDVATAKGIELLNRFGLEGLSTRYPSELSGGEQQRVALVRGLALEPKVLLLDEVTSALDPENVVSVVEALLELRTLCKPDMIIVLVTHLTEFARQFADRVLFIANGVVWDEFPATDFDSHDRKQETVSFLRKLKIAR